MMGTKILPGICGVIIALTSCQQASDRPTSAASVSPEAPALASDPTITAEIQPTISTPQSTTNPEAADEAPVVTSSTDNYGYTHQRADGNRLVSGRGAIPDARVIDVPLQGKPVWVVGAAASDLMDDGSAGSDTASLWAVVMEDGSVHSFMVRDGEVTESTIEPANVGNLPPLLQISEGRPTLLVPPSPAFGPAPPAVLGRDGSQAMVSADGLVTVLDPRGVPVAAAESQPLPDARLLVDGSGRLLYLSQPTTRYDHGIAGDEIEAAAVTLFDSREAGGAELTIELNEPAVIEGIMPLWADLNQDGRREIIVTESDVRDGARIVVYDETGRHIASGPAIGSGYRWRHQLAVAPFGPNGEVELADVLTPHIGGVVEFYQLVGDELQVVAQVPGYTSHVIGSRNLDMALAGDLDGDGRIELLLPNQDRTELGAIQRIPGGAEVAWTVPLEGRLSSNLAAVTLADGTLAVGAGREEGFLRLWLP